MSQPVVAAIQMTSLADVGMNLATARRLLVAARDRGFSTTSARRPAAGCCGRSRRR
jgi:hypothetical protein